MAFAALAAPVASCRRQPSAAPPASELRGVGFELPGNDQVQRGALVTQPPGREEGFLPFVAGNASRWAADCRAETGGATPQLVFQTDDKGGLLAVSPATTPTPRERCLLARAVATPAPALPIKTGVTVQLLFTAK